MAIKITLDSFLAVIKRSTLLSDEQVATALEKFRAGNGITTDAKPFAEYLVRSKQLTVWQAEKVLQGKHKGFFLGRYRLLSLLGKGGMSSVYLAEHMVMKRHCALKVLPAKRVNDASYLGRFHREAQAVAALDHPNIVRAYDVDMTTDAGIEIHFLSMEFVKGKNLLEIVQERGPVPIADGAEMVRQSALGLHHAHVAGLVHRDVKPGNLLYTPTGVIKVLDLGLARFFDDGDHSLTVQHDEKVLGTADYISPEQAIDSHKVDARTDIYSLGCTLYFLLSGHPPFNTGSLAQRLVAHQMKPAPPITNDRLDVPAALQAIMEKMMAKKKDQRYQTAQEVADAIAKWQTDSLISSAPEVVAAVPGEAIAKPVSAVASPPAVQAKPVATSITRPAPASSPQEKKPGGSGVRSANTTGGHKSPLPKASVSDHSGGDAAGDLGNFLSGLSSRIHPGDDDTAPSSDSQASRSSSKKLAQAAVETAKHNQSQTELAHRTQTPLSKDIDLDFLDEVFDPSRLNLDGLDIIEEPAEPESQTPSAPNASRAKPPGKASPAASTPASPAKTSRSIPPLWWVGGGVGLLGLALVGWLIFGGDPNPPKIAPNTKPTKPLPATTLAVIEVGPRGHFTTIGQAVEFVRENFQPLRAQETRTIQVTGGYTYPETLHILSSGRSHFPRNVTVKSVGPTAAVIQGDGVKPVLNIQDAESLTIEGFVIDAHQADIAIRVAGYSPVGRLTALKVKRFQKTAVLLEDVAAQAGEEFQLSDLHIQGDSPEAAGVRCQTASGGNTVCVQLKNLRVIGPLRTGVETSGTFWMSSISDSVIAKCRVGIRFQGGTLIDASLINNTLFQNEQGIVFARLPEAGSGNLKVWHTLFSGNTQADAVLETGDAAALTSMLLSPTEGRHHNRSDRKDADTNGLDVFTGDGQRGVVTTFVSADPSNPGYLKPSTAELNVATPAAGARGYIGAIAP